MNIILVFYLLVVWTAVGVRCDRFPLTWVPMYSTYVPTESIPVVVIDTEDMERGILVTHRDGSKRYVTREELNIPRTHFWRLYYQRMFGAPPAKHTQGNMNLGAVNRWLRGLEEGEPNFTADWNWRIIRSLNKTLGYEPSDPKFIIGAETAYEIARYRKADLLKKDVSKPERVTLRAHPQWKEHWLKRWNDDQF